MQRFRSNGMKDISMIVVNSKLSHSRAEMLLLQDRVSFEVLQETEEDPVWDILEGGKDDMYIYDRCGRLTYYIPFPLSIINDDMPLIHSALMASYFVSPCGVTCDGSTTPLSEDDIHINSRTTTPDPVFDKVTEHGGNTDLTTESVPDFNVTDYIELLTVIEDNMTEAYDYLNRTDDFNLSFTESDYEDSNDTETPNFYNLIQRLFRNDMDYTTTEVYVNNSSFPNEENVTNYVTNTTNMNENDIVVNKTEETGSNDILYHQKEVSQEKEDTPKPKAKAKLPGRCAEADYEICRSWSKKKLLRAQRCCSVTAEGDQISEDVSCRNFGKRRCKKMRYLLKCCIKTNIMDVKQETTTPEVKDERTTEASTTEAVTTEENGYVCCKIVEKEKLCYVPGPSGCEDGESLEKGTSLKK